MSGTKHKGNAQGHVTETPDVSHIKNLDVTHEASDVSVGGILKFVVGLTLFAVLVHVLMWGMFLLLNAQEDKEPPPGPMAMTEQERLPPAPRLQAARGFGVKLENGEWVNLENREPEAEYRVLRNGWEQVLSEGLKDQSGQAVGMPIDEAMQKVLEKGFPTRATKPATAGAGVADSVIAMPTAGSSGRVTEKGTQ